MIHVIFLAHKGISQPHLWDEWKSGEMDIAFYVYTNKLLHKDYIHSKDFCDKYRPLNKYGNEIFLGDTQWGSFSLVYETLKAWHYVCDTTNVKSNDLVFLVSGDDIPVRSASVLLQQHWQNKDFLCLLSYFTFFLKII